MRKKAIFFDFGDVLVSYDHMQGCKALAAYSTKSADEIYKVIFASKLEDQQYNIGVFTDQQWYAMCLKTLKLDCSFEEFAEKWGAIFSPNPKIGTVLNGLRPDLKRFVLSNTNGLHWNWAKTNMQVLAEHFPNKEQAILSCEEKCRKPNLVIYERALERAGISASEAVFVDDKEVNVRAFEGLGGHGIVYSTHTTPITYLAQKLQELGCMV